MSVRPVAAVAAMILGLGLAAPAVAAIPDPDPDDITAVLDVSKSASPTTVNPGDTVTFTIQVGCSAISDLGCRSAITTDAVPAPFVIDSVTTGGPNDAADPEIDGQDVTVTWTESLTDGTTGMVDNTTSQVTIVAHVPDDVSHDYDGQTITNTATAEATNAADDSGTATVTINVPLELETSATKEFDPTTALASTGTPVTAGLSGTNESNDTVDTLAIQDPVDPSATPNPFTYLGFTGFGDITPPAGTTSTTYEVYVEPGGWTAAPGGNLPAGVDPEDVEGTRVTFTGDIPAGATGSVDLDLETTDEAASVTDDTTITNDVQSEVSLDGVDSDPATASDDFVIQANAVEVGAAKSFDPNVVVAGESSTVTVEATNNSAIPIDTLTITEPSSGSFPPAYTFGGFAGPIPFPSGAGSATVTYQPSGEVVTFGPNQVPDPPADGFESVTSFSIQFEGDIAPGASTSSSFDVDTDPDASPLPTTVENEVAVEGENDGATDEATASDDLFVYDETIEPYIDKNIYPSQILANPGEVVTVALEGGTTEEPDPPAIPDGTTGDADQIVIQDPLDPVDGNAWWNAFDLGDITQTPIPADSTLTVYYYDPTDPAADADGWVLLDGPVGGPDIYSYDVPDDVSQAAGGIRFVYDYTGDGGGFPPGTDLTPRFTSVLRSIGRYDNQAPPYNTDPDQASTLVPNCAQSSASNDTTSGDAAMDLATCPDIEIIPVDGEGVGDLLDKAFLTSSSGGAQTVIARSGDTIPSTLRWSTGGYSGFETVDLTDVADPEGTDVADSVFDAFDLLRVREITDSTDPYIKYDRVASVQLWNGAAWVDAANDPCPAACDGTFPGVGLTNAEQASTLGVRLTFEESPTRATTANGDPAAPPVGSGVARSFGNNRAVTLVWEVRDDKRSNGDAVLEDETYNLPGSPGVVRNHANATGHPADGGPDISDDAADDVSILDVAITTTTTKDWLGGPVAIPVEGTPENNYPLSRIRVTTRNTTPARVDQMQIVDPTPGSTTTQDPFDYFDVARIAGITEPAGTTSTQVVLTCDDGSTQPSGTPGYYTRAEALALTTMPCDVVGIQVLFDGRIESAGTGVLALDVRLRATVRGTSDPVTVDDSPVVDSAQGIVADVDAIQDCPPPQDARYACADDPASIEIVAPSFGIRADKSISPAVQVEGDFAPVTVTVSAQNTGSARPYLDTITDDDPTFWNAVDFLQMDPSWVLPQPVQFVQACYLSGGTFTDVSVAEGSVGGTWTCQELPHPPPYTAGELTLDQARAFIDDAASTVDIHGLRFSFMAGVDEGWQDPAHPLIEVPFQVQRRDDAEGLRSGGPVPTTRSDQSPAPGETDAGVFVDTVEVDGESVLIGAGTRLDDDDTADADYTHDHKTVGVEVDKSPDGEVPPGTVIPFELTYTNTGEAALTDPVFTDVLPSDADGPQLIFDPDGDPSISSPYAFELDGDAPEPPNGDPLPTDEADIDITQAGDAITFAMPPGTVLEPGQTYTITIELQLRPGLTPDDVVTNTATVIADEPFDPDACTPTYDAGTGECSDTATLSPERVAALSTVKRVKADVPVNEAGIPEVWLDRDVIPAGAEVPDDYCDTAADADGFYRFVCVPVTYPGDTETWRYTVTNTGTLPLDQLVSIDVLPHVGDTGTIVPLARGSEWTPTWADEFGLTTDTPDVVASAFYSPTYDVCTDDLDPLGPPCPAGAWLPYDPDTVADGDVYAVKTVLMFPDGSRFNPGDSVVFEGKTRTTPEFATDSSFPVAWNTVASGGVSNDGGTRASVPATEGRKVGVTYPTGPIALQKIVTGDGAAYAPDSFEVQLECTMPANADQPAYDLTDLPVLTLVPDAEPTQVDGLPWGAECTATETDQGQTSETIGTATVGGPEDDIGLITVENEFDLGDMSVTKTVDTDAVDQDGNPITYGPFEAAVDCTFLGEEVYADGYDADDPMVFEIEDGVPFPLTGLPVGAECVTTETDDADAVSVDIAPETVTIGGDNKDPADVEAVEITNHYGVGSMQLDKSVTGDALANDPDLVDGPFTLHVTCTLTDASHPDGETVYDDDVVLTGVAPDNTTTIDNLATGAVCDVTEPDQGGATTQSIDPDLVTIGDGTTVEVTVTNTFDAGSMTVTKAVDTDAVDQDGNPISYGPFQVAVACTFRGADVYGDGFSADDPMTDTIDAGETWTIDGVPVGAECTTTEPDDADAVAVDIAPASVTIGGEDADPAAVEAVTVTNQYDVGSLQLIKEVAGDALDNNPVLGQGPFTLHVTCTLTDASHDGTTVYDDDVILEGEQPLETTIEDLPTDAECTVTESDQGGATSYTIDPADGVVTIGDGTTVDVTASNTFAVGDMTVTKSVDTDAVDQDGNPISYGPFQVAVRCTLDGNIVYADGYSESPMIFEITDTGTVPLEDLPIGARCVTTEPGAADAADVDISPQAVTIGGDDSDPDEVQAVAVTNHYDVGSLLLRKFVTEAAEEYPISQGPFTLHVTCTLTDASHPDGTVVYDADVVLQGAQPLSTQIDDLATGSVCEVTEPDPGAATAHVVTPRTVTIGEDSTVEVVVSNFFGAGALTITKAVEGPGADLYGAGPFEVEVTCTYTDVNGDDVPVNTPGGAVRELSADNDYTVTYEPLLFGSTCQVEETKTGGANDSVITDADGNEVSEITVDSLTEDLALTVTNTFDVGRVKVKKVVKGVGPGPFTVRLACTYDVDGTTTKVDVPGGDERTLRSRNDLTAIYEDLPAGADCTLEETANGGADTTEITPNDGDPSVGTATVEDGTTVRLKVVNTFDDASTGPGTTTGPGTDLPGTGSDLPWWTVWMGIAMIALGGLTTLVGLRRRGVLP